MGRWRRAGAAVGAILVAGLVAGACGSGSSGPPRPRPSPTTTAPPATTEAACSPGVAQSMDGAVHGCLRVGDLAPGTYHVVVDQVLGGGPTGPAPTVPLRLSPASGRPGTAVEVSGTLPASAGPVRSLGATLCWGGCVHGLAYSPLPPQWSGRTFRIRFVVPAAPWLDPSSGALHRLAPGTYTVEVRFVLARVVAGRLVRRLGPDASGRFRLDAPASGAPWCPSAAACGELRVSPDHTVPAGVVEVRGFAPLASVIGTEPFVHGLAVERGAARGPEVVLTRTGRPGTTDSLHVALGHAPLRVGGALDLARLGPLRVVSSQVDGSPPVSANPADPDRVAWCAPGAVVVAEPGGETRVPVAGVAAALAGSHFSLFGPRPVTCDRAALAGTGPTVFAAFTVVGTEAPPPVEEAALYTTDGGRTWRLVRVPPGARLDGFGGFEYARSTVEALFTPDRPEPTPLLEPTPLVEETADGGARWATAPLACPSAGPCAVLGASDPDECASTGALQLLLWSNDAGRSWSTPAWPSGIDNACFAGELVATSSGRLLLAQSAESPAPDLLLSSSDGGRTWADVAVPGLPDRHQLEEDAAGLTVLPDGGLLLTLGDAPVPRLELLAPGATHWCTVTGLPAGAATSEGVVVGSQLWWRTGLAGASHVPLASLRC